MNFPPEIHECPNFCFSEEQKSFDVKGPWKKGVQKGPSTVLLYDQRLNLKFKEKLKVSELIKADF